mgnify:CR=1 FL=1
MSAIAKVKHNAIFGSVFIGGIGAEIYALVGNQATVAHVALVTQSVVGIIKVLKEEGLKKAAENVVSDLKAQAQNGQ